MTRYEVTDFVDRKKPGQAVIEAFFTAKGDDVYAIIPGWPGRQFVLKDAAAGPGMSVAMLGGGGLKWSCHGRQHRDRDAGYSGRLGQDQYAYTIRLHGLR